MLCARSDPQIAVAYRRSQYANGNKEILCIILRELLTLGSSLLYASSQAKGATGPVRCVDLLTMLSG